MSYDLAIWDGPRPADDRAAADTYDALFERWMEGDENSPPTPPIRIMAEEIDARWPPLERPGQGFSEAPWSVGGPVLDSVSGPMIYLCMSFRRAEEVCAFAAQRARALGLVCFDPQEECLI